MNRRFALLVPVAALVTATTGAALAEPPASAPALGQHRVCAVPSGLEAECNAHVLTNGRTAAPLATTDYQNGFDAQTLQNVYKPGSQTAVVAVVDAYANPNAASDLSTYRTQFNLGAATFSQYDQNGNPLTFPGTVKADVGWGQEEMLDLEMVSALCKACPIIYVGATSNSFSDLVQAVKTAKLKGAKVISNSYGAPEFSSETLSQYSDAYNVSGVAVTVSSGDNGYGVEYPAAAKNVIAVGGTSLTVDGSHNRLTESVWSGAGSGCSSYVAKPAWQSNHSTGCSRRMVSDISAVADPYTGVAVYDSYGSTGASWYVFGGTSVAAPLVGAVYASYGVPAATSGYPVENAWKASTGVLYDVVGGSNGRCTKGRNSGPSLWCSGVTGYDGPSGNGTPNGSSSAF